MDLRFVPRFAFAIATLAGSTVVAGAQTRSETGAGPTTVVLVGVSDATSGAALDGAEVFFPALGRSGRADGLGEVRVPDIPSGAHRIRVRYLGYSAIDTTLQFAGDTAAVLFRLQRTALTMDAVEVKAVATRLRDFELRRRIGTGRYLTAEELDHDANRPFGVVAMTRFPGLQLVNDADGRPHIASTRGSCGVGVSPSEGILAGARGGGSGGRGAATTGSGAGGGQGSGGGGSGSGAGTGGPSGATRTSFGSCMPSKACYVITFLDGIQLDSADFDIITTWDIAGVEYYTGNSVPPRYRVSGAACGVMLVWSK